MADTRPSPEEVATRAVALAAVITRAVAEDLIAEGDAQPGFVALTGHEPGDIAGALKQWLERERLDSHLTPNEKMWMAKPSGTWKKQEIINGCWRREALMAIEWAIRIIEPLPPQDARIPMEDLLEGAWLFKETAQFRRDASLRLAKELSEQRDIAEFWLWRSRTFKMQNLSEEDLQTHKTSKEELRAIVEHAAATGENKGIFRCINGDFPALGKPFRDLTSGEWSRMNSVCTERLYGLNWLCGVDAPDWDSVELSA
jgi:uncharacterized protein DUF4272